MQPRRIARLDGDRALKERSAEDFVKARYFAQCLMILGDFSNYMSGTALAFHNGTYRDAGSERLHLCMLNENGEPPAITLTIPSRWNFDKLTHAQAIEEVDRLAQILVKGTDALCGLYLRICETMRVRQFTDEEIRSVLGKYFPQPRVSEFIKIANAPPEVYRRYYAGFIGFRAALAECRGYRINSDEHLKRKKIRRTAERLIELVGQGEVTVKGKRVTIL